MITRIEYRDETPAERGVTLTDRQKDIVILLADGLVRKEVAGRLGLSVRTVEAHVQQAYKRLGIPKKKSAGKVSALIHWAAKVELLAL